MSVIQLERSDARDDALLKVSYESDWSRMRSGHSGREVFAYAILSDSGATYETELFISDREKICGYCGCAARVLCRHLKAALEDLLQREPTFGQSLRNEQENNEPNE